MGVPVRDFLKARRDRAVGTILGWAEREIAGSLTREQFQEFRRVVIDATNSYHDTVLDLVKVEDGVRNDAVLEILERLERRIVPAARSNGR